MREDKSAAQLAGRSPNEAWGRIRPIEEDLDVPSLPLANHFVCA
jgi:hypothetical protein